MILRSYINKLLDNDKLTDRPGHHYPVRCYVLMHTDTRYILEDCIKYSKLVT